MDPHTDYKQVELAARRRRAVRRAVTYVLLALWAVIVLFPFYWMVLTSVKSYSAYSSERIPAFSPCPPPSRTTVMPSPPCRWAATS